MAHTSFREPYPPRAELPAPLPAALAGQISTGYRWAGGGDEPQPFEFISQIAPAGAALVDRRRHGPLHADDPQRRPARWRGAVQRRHRLAASAPSSKTAAPGLNGFDDGFMDFALPGGYPRPGSRRRHPVVPFAVWSPCRTLNLGVFVTTNTDTGAGLAAACPS